MFENFCGVENILCRRFDADVEYLVQHFAGVWNYSRFDVPDWGRKYSSKEQSLREKDVEKFLSTIKKESKKCGYTATEKLRNYEKFSPAIRSFLKNGLGFEDEEIEILFSNDFLKITSQFIEASRDFDPSISNEDISQALRNVWTMNWIQMLLNKPVEMTKSVFAYSLLYPYTDNYIDNLKVSCEEKNGFNNRLADKLAGGSVLPKNKNEEKVFKLVEMIEEQFNRAVYPNVFESLIAIHTAQTKSMKLSSSEILISCDELLNISLEKGGTSVLADGYLIAGDLTETQKTFLFGFGAYLQLIDDLQDVSDDYAGKVKTVFSTDDNKLDKLIGQLNCFGERVLFGSGSFGFGEKFSAFDMMKKSCRLLSISAVGITSEFYNSAFLKMIEVHSPFRFSFLRKYQFDYLNKGMSLLNLTF
jgi:hypothetical protein